MQDEFDATIEARDKQAAYDALPAISFEQLMAVINKWLLIIDPGVVKFVCALIIANRMPSDPVWAFLLAPSGGGKTELMNGLLKCPDYYPLSQLTTNTFLSGFKTKAGSGKEASLLKQLGSGKTIGLKDFTSILDGNKDEFKEIMGQFREIHDGHMSKRTGTGEEITWKGKLGFIAGCTPILEERMTQIGAMGERFLSYKMKNPTRKELRLKMRSNMGKEGEMRDEIQDAFAGYLKGVVIPTELPTVSDQVDGVIESMTDFIAISRAVVMRDRDAKQEIRYIVEPEMSSRTYKQLYTIAIALTVMNGENKWNPEDDYILRNLAISSIHSIRYNLIRRMMAFKTQVKTTTMAMELGYPTTTTRRYLEDLAAISMDDGTIKIITRVHQGKGKSDLWQVTPAMKEILALMGEIIEPIKEDTKLEDLEEDIPIGSVMGSSTSQPAEIVDEEELAGGLSEDDRLRFGI